MLAPHHRVSAGCLAGFCLLITLGGCSGKATQENSQTASQTETAAKVPAERERNSSPNPDPTRQSSQNNIAAAKAAYAANRLDQALRFAQAQLVSQPQHSEALFLAADCLLQMGRSGEGFEMLGLIPIDDPTFGLEAAGRLADWHLSSGRPAEAQQQFQKIIATHGDLPLAYSRLALLANAQGRRYEASKYLYKLAQMQDITRRELGALITISDPCIVESVPGTSGSPQQPLEGDLRRAQQMRMRGQWDSCQALAEDLRKRFPDSVAIAAFLGTVYADQQKSEDLRRWHLELPAGIKEQPEYWTAMATWMELQGQTKAALRCCCESLSRDPTNSLLYDKFAQLLRSLGLDSAADQATERYDLLADVLRAYNRTLESDVVVADYIEISERLLSLRRPWEAVGWRNVAAKSEPASVGQLDSKIKEYFSMQTATGPQWLLCGIDRQRFELPDLASLQTDRENPLPGGPGQIRLEDVADKVGLQFQYQNGNDATDGSYFLHEMMGGGIGVIDYDRDGFPDLYMSQGGGSAFAADSRPNELHRNLSGQGFRQVTTESDSGDRGYGQGVAIADYNQDGFADILVANIGKNVCLRNNGDGTFTRVELDNWSENDRWTSLIAVGDLSGDGLPELFECNYVDDRAAITERCSATAASCGPIDFDSATDRVLSLRADGTFDLWPAATDMEQSPNWSLGAIIANVDDRAGNDLFIANDTGPNALWVSSEASGEAADRYRLQEEARLRGCATGLRGSLLGCMGITSGDFDGDSLIDLFVTNYLNEPSNFYCQRSAGLFIDKAGVYGLREATLPMVGFGTQACDIDRDGHLDLAVLNGHAIDRRHLGEPLEMTPQFFRGTRGSFERQTLKAAFWSRPTIGRSLAVLDWNLDGKPDLIAGHVDAPAALLENDSTIGNWIRFDLVGTLSERDAVGAKVLIVAGDRTFTSWITGGDGYHCSNESTVDFGVGEIDTIDELTIRWPSGEVQGLGPVAVNRRYVVVEGEETPFEVTVQK